MTKQPLCRCVRVLVYLAIFSTNWPAAFAGEPVRREEPLWRQSPNENRMPLLYKLPESLPAQDSSVVTIEVLNNGRPAIRQRVELQDRLPEASVIEVLADHPDELKHVRKLESVQPGSVRLVMWLGDQFLQERSLRELEGESRRLTLRAVPTVGTTRQVDVLAGGGLTRIAEDASDPVCLQGCEEQFGASCIEAQCDPRSTYCPCNGYYDSCVASCPECPTTREYSTTTVTGQSYYNSTRCFQGFGTFGEGRTHQLSYRTLRTQTWRETRNCDGSTSTTLLSTSNRSETCWQQFNSFCSPWVYNNTAYPTCFPY